MDSSKLEEIEALTGSPPIISDISDLSEISELPETQENFSKAEHQIKMDAFDLSEILNERTEKLLTSSKSKRRSSSEKTFSPKIISNVPEKAIYCTESEYNDQLEMTVKLSKMENPTVAWLEQDNGANSGQDFKCIDAKIATDCDGISKCVLTWFKPKLLTRGVNSKTLSDFSRFLMYLLCYIFADLLSPVFCSKY